MGRFLLSRLGRALVTLWLVSLVVFVMLRLVPGDPAVLLAGQEATPEQVAEIRTRLGLDRPIPVQYLRWLAGVARGDLGRSIRSKQPVAEEVAGRMPATLALGLLAIALALALGLALGIAAALRAGRWPDLAVLAVALLAISAPSFWVGLLLVLVFAVHLGILPVAGSEGWAAYVLPVATLVPLSLAIFARLSRSTMLDVLGEDYIRTAVAVGARRRTILWRHALRNAIIPIITIAGLELARVLGGVIAVETIFAWPGAGKALVDAIMSRDFPMVQGLVLAFALVFALLNIAVDIANGAVDPRVRAR
jgi:peptide/nickel transport system permease protein/oligopeptide transport system permease protein